MQGGKAVTGAAQSFQKFGIISAHMLKANKTLFTFCVAFSALSAALSPRAKAERIEVDIEALVASTNQYTDNIKLATTNGWTLSGIDSYADKPNIRLSEKEDYLISPTFSQRISRIELMVKSSSQTGRRLVFIPIYDGIPSNDTSLWSLCDYSPNKDTYVPRTISFAHGANVHAFKMDFDNGGGSTGWGVSAMTIVTHDAPDLAAPADLSASDVKKTSCRLSWTNPVNAVSNKIEVSQISVREAYGSALDEYDFAAFTNTATNAKDCYDKNSLQMDAYPSFSGTNIYAAGCSTGVVQISSSDSQGYLRYDFSSIRDALAENADASLLVSAKKHATDISSVQWKLLVAQINDSGETNRTEEVDLCGEFPSSPFSIQIDNPKNCQAIVLRPSDATKKNRRILVDHLAFTSTGPIAVCETNLVKTAFATGCTTCSIDGLTPRTEYIARATAFDTNGNESDPSEPISFTTDGSTPPFAIRLK